MARPPKDGVIGAANGRRRKSASFSAAVTEGPLWVVCCREHRSGKRTFPDWPHPRPGSGRSDRPKRVERRHSTFTAPVDLVMVNSARGGSANAKWHSVFSLRRLCSRYFRPTGPSGRFSCSIPPGSNPDVFAVVAVATLAASGPASRTCVRLGGHPGFCLPHLSPLRVACRREHRSGERTFKFEPARGLRSQARTHELPPLRRLAVELAARLKG